MDNSDDKKSANKYEDQIKLRKAKLEKMRKERQVLQLEKLKREKTTQEHLEYLRLKNEIREKAKELNDTEIDKIQQEINKFNEDAKSTRSEVLDLKSSEKNIRSGTKTLTLKCSKMQITEIPPIETATYSKHTQTDISRIYKQNDENKFDFSDMEYHDDVVAPLRLRCSFSSNLPPGILSPGLPRVMDIQPAVTPIDKKNPFNFLKEKNKKILEEKCEEMLSSQIFQTSLERVSRKMERILKNNKNINIDYTGVVADEKDINDNNSKGLLRFNRVFVDKNLTNRRCITCIDWSPHYPDQIVAAYFKNEESFCHTAGDVIIWNINLKNQTPEHVFHCHSSVLSLCFTKCNPNLVLGATYSGQIVMWDNRVKTSIPVQCTQLNYKAHTQPVYCLREIGCESSHNIMSISSDGKLCSWNLDMLAHPTDIMQLQLDISEKIKKPISVTCMDFPVNGRNNLILGGEDGCAYSAFSYGYESGINNRYEKHESTVTGISAHYNQASTDLGNLFLTSSMDCTIKLWSLEKPNPSYTFKNNYDCVMDVAWSPVHPSLFIAADGSGCLDLYNVNENNMEPMYSINLKDGTAINRVKWNSSGQCIAVGTLNGELYLYNVAEDLANPNNNEWDLLKESLRDININNAIEVKEE